MWSFWSLSALLALSLTPLMALGATVPITFKESGSQLAHSSSINSSAALPSASLSPTNRIPNPFPVPSSGITLHFMNEPQPPMPAANILSCLQAAYDTLLAYLRTHPDGPLFGRSFEFIWNNVYFGAVSDHGTLTYRDVLWTLVGFTFKVASDGSTEIAADILVGGTDIIVGSSVVQWATVATDES